MCFDLNTAICFIRCNLLFEGLQGMVVVMVGKSKLIKKMLLSENNFEADISVIYVNKQIPQRKWALG